MKGIIYKIICNVTGEVYYGSSKKTSKVRMSNHKANYKYWKKGMGNFVTSYQIIDRGNYSYVLLETVECNDKKQLEALEQRYIINNECVNKYVVGRSDKQYYEDNKERIIVYQNKYREINKDVIKEKKRIYYLKQKALIKNNLFVEIDS